MQISPELAGTVSAIVDEGSLEGAARALRITPSAVSQRLRSLEAQLGRVLIVRSKPARATEAGAVVVRLARQYGLLAHDASVALGLEGPGRMSVPIAVNADSLATWLLPGLEPVTRTHDVAFELRREDEDRTAALLEAGTVMAAVTSQREPIAGCTVTALGDTIYDAVATPGYVARWLPDGVTASALAGAPLIDFDRADDVQSAWLRERGVDPSRPPRHYVPASEDYAAAVRLGFGWGMLPPLQAKPGIETGLLVKLGEPRLRVPLYWQQWNLRSPLLTAIREAVVTAARAALPPERG
ncbi:MULTISPECIES: LysR family transcriptional regulator ArgP [Microbacterium]|uniref:Transcriptional regulator ArgP n=1 Tax=Microbacterium barkeri TaxID=33917 RepID=A0A9W6LXT8_9MICO|nr:LysR family transcriptional regulator ArgP [Microbacterium barkeri]MDR6875428.1 LysR family transcriptional regulator (chromosome initiation inhibitor) [Microbacterium barkeri]GLJ62560.1 transcriptional regulator ArgP [Microbacterium barkeri]